MSEIKSQFESLLRSRTQSFFEVQNRKILTSFEKLHQQKKLIFPGSFNPISPAHRQMAMMATEKTQLPLWFEISIQNVEKPPIQFPSLINRLSEDFGGHGILISNAPTFELKLELYRPLHFVVGADTLLRINDLRFYDDAKHFRHVIQKLSDSQANFIVFERRMNGERLRLRNAIQPALDELCQFIPIENFDMPISSTEIRRQRGLE